MSCIVSNNKYGLKRISSYKFTLNPNQNSKVYNLIDTTAFYKTIYIEDSINNTNNNGPIRKNVEINSGLVFYTNGKVGGFYDYNSPTKQIDYDPSKAVMGYYEYKDGVLYLEFLKNYPTGNFLSIEIIVRYTEDTLVSFVQKTARGGGFKNIYVRQELPENVLDFKPDW